MDKLSLEDVRGYLFESNAIEEAESVILKNLLTNKPHPSNTKEPKSPVNSSNKQKEVNGLHTIRISDLLGDYEKTGTAKTNAKYEKQLSDYKATEVKNIEEERKTKSDSLYEFERVAEAELQALEKRRLLMEAKLVEKRKDMEKYDIIQNIKNNTSTNSTSFTPIIKNINNSSVNQISEQNQRELNELSHQHALRVAENKMKILEAQHELHLLNTGKFDFSTPLTSTAVKSQSPRGTASQISSLSEDMYQKARVNQILTGLGSEEEVSAHRSRIETMRSSAAREASAIKEEPLLTVKSSSPAKQPSLNPSPSLSGSKVARDMTVNQYLDLWLEREAAPVGEHLPPPLPTLNGSSSSASIGGGNNNSSGDGMKGNSSLVNSALQSLSVGGGGVRREQQTQSPRSNPTVNNNNSNNPDNNTESVDAMIQRLQNENRALRAEKVDLLQRDITGRPQVNNNNNSSNNSGSPQRNSISSIDQFRNHAAMFQPQNQPFNNYNQSQNQQPFNPYAPPNQQMGGPGGFNPYSQNPYAQQPSQYQQQPQQQPFYQPPPQQQLQMQPAPVDPMLQQMQRMTEQIERENQKLMGQLNNPNNGMADFSDPQSDVFSPPPNSNLQPLPGERNKQMYMLERDRVGKPRNNPFNNDKNQQNNQQNNNLPILTREEQQQQSELKAINHEIEKLKCTAELEELRSDFQRAKITRTKEMEHADWLEAQRHELQAVKMKQVLAKEQRLLKMQLEGSELLNNPDLNKPIDPSTPQAPIDTQKHHNLKEECGVGVLPLPLDLSKGVSVLIDGLLITSKTQIGSEFRIVIGIYDRTGKVVVRTHTTEWQHWDAPTTPISDTNTSMNIQYTSSNAMRTLKQQQQVGAAEGSVLGAKVLLEIQTRAEGETQVKPLGWAILSLTLTPSPLIGGEPTLANNAWRAVLRSGITDPNCDPQSTTPLLSEELIENAYVLLRVIDSGEANRATSWVLKECTELTSNMEALLHFYQDPLTIPIKLPSGDNNKPPGSAAVPQTSRSVKQAPLTLTQPPQTPSRPGSSAIIDNIINTSRKINTPQKASTPMPLTNRPISSQNRPLTTNPSNTSLKPPMEQLVEGDENTNTANNSVKLRSLDDKSYWYLGTPTGPATERYQRGDGVDIYFDSAMFLPDSVTFTRLSVSLFAANRDRLGVTYDVYALASSPATSPVFKHKIELRNSNALDITMMAVVRFDTFDYNTCLPVGVAYACFKIFSTRDRQQPKSGADLSTVYINTGLFQLPLHGGKVPGKPDIPEFNDNMLRTQPRIPCASLLVRILQSPKSPDGVSVLSRNEFPADDWLRLGLDTVAPSYASGAYNGSPCEPSATELICYAAKAANVVESVETALLQAMSAKGSDNGRAPRPVKHTNPVEDEKNVRAWLSGLFNGITINRVLDFSLCVPYSTEIGTHVSVESLYNLPEGTMFSNTTNLMYKVICSLTPPGLFYKDPPLSEGVFYTKEHNLQSHFRAPGFRQIVTEPSAQPIVSTPSGPTNSTTTAPPSATATAVKKAPLYRDTPFLFTPPNMSPSMCLLLDIRTIRVEPNKNTPLNPVVTVEPPLGRKCYWTMLPLSRERILGQGGNYCQSGLFQLPLFEGAVPYKELFKSNVNPHAELITRLKSKNKANSIKVLEGASIIVNIYNPALVLLQTSALLKTDPLIQNLFMNELLEAAEVGLSGAAARLDKFTYDATRYPNGTKENKLKTTQQTLPLPKTASDEAWSDLMKSVNKAFELAVNINA